jgi:hypothetical protein
VRSRRRCARRERANASVPPSGRADPSSVRVVAILGPGMNSAYRMGMTSVNVPELTPIGGRALGARCWPICHRSSLHITRDGRLHHGRPGRAGAELATPEVATGAGPSWPSRSSRVRRSGWTPPPAVQARGWLAAVAAERRPGRAVTAPGGRARAELGHRGRAGHAAGGSGPAGAERRPGPS